MGKTDFDFRKLHGRIKEIYGRDCRFAKDMGLCTSALSGRLNNKTPWRSEEIPEACKLLDIPAEKIGLYFFTQKVR